MIITGVWETALAFVTALLSVWLVLVALAGFYTTAIPAPLRIVLALAGLLALIPSGALAHGWWTDIAGVIGAIVNFPFIRNKTATPAH